MATVDNSHEQSKINEQLKSIVYGDAIKNKHGAFRCFCATISDENQIENIVSYLRKNTSFHRLNKFSYSYRISHYDKVIESYYNDPRLEGCGEKLLHLLQKFNVENVLLIIGVDRKDNFGLLTPEYYHTIIERAKDLLSTLYEKVLENDFSYQKEPFLTSLQEQTSIDSSYHKPRDGPTVTILDSSMIPEHQTAKKLERPNHFLSPEQRQRLQAQKGKQATVVTDDKDKEKLLHSVLKNNLKRNFEKIKMILDDWQDNDYQHLKFICLYDKHVGMTKVFKMLMTIDDVKSIQDLAERYDFKERLPALAGTVLTKEKSKKLGDVLRQDKHLNPKVLARDNPVVAGLLEYITILVRNYELSEQILALEAKKSPEKRKTVEGVEYSKMIIADIEEERKNIVLDLTKDLAYAIKEHQKGNTSLEGGHTPQPTSTESDQQLLPKVISSLENKLKSPEKDKNTLQKDDSGKKTSFIARGLASVHNSNNAYTVTKHERLKSNTASLSDTDNYMEPKFGGQTPVETKIEASYDPKPNNKKVSRGKSPSIGSDKSSLHKERSANEDSFTTKSNITSSKEHGSGMKPPISGFSQKGERSPSRNSGGSKGVRVSHAQDDGLEEGFYDNIPDDPDEIRRYLDENPIEGQPDMNLEVIAEKLTKHRLNNS